jgi:hypothetical protein
MFDSGLTRYRDTLAVVCHQVWGQVLLSSPLDGASPALSNTPNLDTPPIPDDEDASSHWNIVQFKCTQMMYSG